MLELNAFTHLMFIGIIALFPVVNPIGSAFIVMPYLARLDAQERRRAVRKIAAYAFGISTVALLGGHFIMALFGISIPIVQMAGGLMICKLGWEFLSSDKEDKPADDTASIDPGARYKRVEGMLFYPITFPITTGAGTISVLFTLSAHGTNTDLKNYLINMSAIFLSIVFMCLLIYLFYLKTDTIVFYLGAEGQKIFNRIIAFLIFCVGLQIATSGVKTFFFDAPASTPSRMNTPLAPLPPRPISASE